jgi:hypothetical protein
VRADRAGEDGLASRDHSPRSLPLMHKVRFRRETSTITQTGSDPFMPCSRSWPVETIEAFELEPTVKPTLDRDVASYQPYWSSHVHLSCLDSADDEAIAAYR